MTNSIDNSGANNNSDNKSDNNSRANNNTQSQSTRLDVNDNNSAGGVNNNNNNSSRLLSGNNNNDNNRLNVICGNNEDDSVRGNDNDNNSVVGNIKSGDGTRLDSARSRHGNSGSVVNKNNKNLFGGFFSRLTSFRFSTRNKQKNRQLQQQQQVVREENKQQHQRVATKDDYIYIPLKVKRDEEMKEELSTSALHYQRLYSSQPLTSTYDDLYHDNAQTSRLTERTRNDNCYHDNNDYNDRDARSTRLTVGIDDSSSGYAIDDRKCDVDSIDRSSDRSHSKRVKGKPPLHPPLLTPPLPPRIIGSTPNKKSNRSNNNNNNNCQMGSDSEEGKKNCNENNNSERGTNENKYSCHSLSVASLRNDGKFFSNFSDFFKMEHNEKECDSVDESGYMEENNMVKEALRQEQEKDDDHQRQRFYLRDHHQDIKINGINKNSSTNNSVTICNHHRIRPVGLLETDLDTEVTAITTSAHLLNNHTGGNCVGAKTRSLLNFENDYCCEIISGVGGGGASLCGNQRRRPHKSMEFLLDRENVRAVEPPENELSKKSSMTSSEHKISEQELRIQRSLHRLDLPEWYTRYNNGTAMTSDNKRYGGSSNKWASSTLSPNSTSTPFVRWSTTRLNTSSCASSPCASTRSSFNVGHGRSSSSRNLSMTLSPTASLRSAKTSIGYRQKPYMGWRSQERLEAVAALGGRTPRTPAERLVYSILLRRQQQQQKEQDERHNTFNTLNSQVT